MKKNCFVVCPIGNEGSEIRKQADILFDHVIEPACDKFNFNPIRADKIATTGLITNKVIKNLRDAEIVVADLTGHNPNVFYELGVRHALNKHVILIKNQKDKRPFDIQSINIIDYLSLDDPKEMQKLKNNVIKHIESILNELLISRLNKPLISDYFEPHENFSNYFNRNRLGQSRFVFRSSSDQSGIGSMLR